MLVLQISSCDVCQRVKGKFDRPAPSLHPVPVKYGVWQQIGVDLIGPLPETLSGNKYIMTVTVMSGRVGQQTLGTLVNTAYTTLKNNHYSDDDYRDSAQ